MFGRKKTDKPLDEQEVFRLCVCPQCPSFVECKKIGFCLESVGKSGCIKEEKGCICPGCPVTDKLNLQHAYYCTRGSEKQQTK